MIRFGFLHTQEQAARLLSMRAKRPEVEPESKQGPERKFETGSTVAEPAGRKNRSDRFAALCFGKNAFTLATPRPAVVAVIPFHRPRKEVVQASPRPHAPL